MEIRHEPACVFETKTPVELNPAFNSNVFNYSVEVPAGTESVTVLGQTRDSNATVTGDGIIDVSSGSGVSPSAAGEASGDVGGNAGGFSGDASFSGDYSAPDFMNKGGLAGVKPKKKTKTYKKGGLATR